VRRSPNFEQDRKPNRFTILMDQTHPEQGSPGPLALGEHSPIMVTIRDGSTCGIQDPADESQHGKAGRVCRAWRHATRPFLASPVLAAVLFSAALEPASPLASAVPHDPGCTSRSLWRQECFLTAGVFGSATLLCQRSSTLPRGMSAHRPAVLRLDGGGPGRGKRISRDSDGDTLMRSGDSRVRQPKPDSATSPAEGL